MPESETYVTKQNPTLDDWLAYNNELFSQMKGEAPAGTPSYAPLIDVDDYAAREEVSTEEYFEKVKNRVGALGHFGLHLVHSEMDEAWHIVVGPAEETI